MLGGSSPHRFFRVCFSLLSLLFPLFMNGKIVIELQNRADFVILFVIPILNFLYNPVRCVNNRL